MTFKAIIFDMDGLLVDSEPVWEEAENSVLASYGKTHTPDGRQQLIGLRMDEFLDKMRAIYGIQASAEALYDDVLERMLALIPTRVRPQPGAAEMLHYVANSGFPAAIASSSPSLIIEAVVKSQGWADLLPVRCSAQTVARGKPAPDVYLKAADVLGISPEHCLALEDSPNGARAAVAAGMTCYAVPDPSHSGPEAFLGITDNVFESLHEALVQLKQN
ncbi:MAG: HAD family phosphatase [Anaerolineae bacterium]|nr:HAD family phosphatase [Anaerolineae bacterium]